MKYFIIVLALVILFSFNVIYASADDGTTDNDVLGYFICPSCQQLAMVKTMKRINFFGSEVTDHVLYCRYCGYNTERDEMGNIKTSIVNLWEFRYDPNFVKPASPNCGCQTKTVLTY